MGAFLTFVGVVVAVVIWWRRFNRTHDTVMSVLKTRQTTLDKRAPRDAGEGPEDGGVSAEAARGVRGALGR